MKVTTTSFFVVDTFMQINEKNIKIRHMPSDRVFDWQIHFLKG